MGALGFWWSAAAFAGEIYRCQVNGVTTFVDSPRQCAEGGAQRQGRDEPKTKDAAPPPVERTRSGAGSASPEPLPTPVRSSPPPPPPPPPVASVCVGLAQAPARFRECLRDQRRAEVRKTASVRLAAISRALTDHLGAASKAGSVIAIGNKDRPTAWCESILMDVMGQRDIDIVDDESTGGPQWVQAGNSPGRSASEILDPNFRFWSYRGGEVPDGYVTARWRHSNLVVLRVVAACVDVGDGTAHCEPRRHSSIYVHDNDTPVACHVTVVERAYWPNWKDTMTPIFAKGLPR